MIARTNQHVPRRGESLPSGTREAGFEQEPHLQRWSRRARISRRAGSCARAQVDHGRWVPGAAGIRRAVSEASPCSSSRGRAASGQRREERMPADPPEPVGGVARVGLAAMGDAVPVGREIAFAQVVGLLGGLVAGIPEVVDLEQPGRERQPRPAARRPGTPRPRAGSDNARIQPGTAAAWPGPAAVPGESSSPSAAAASAATRSPASSHRLRIDRGGARPPRDGR